MLLKGICFAKIYACLTVSMAYISRYSKFCKLDSETFRLPPSNQTFLNSG
ncbi:hypothetical protein DLM78_22480 [Leptospira stimsonii]|uniref:Uncharacterized protein n=1 Tax=Leptospira stimsonii TaxID=2202203 RepID=A0A8B3CHI3_9LEPT|nr:hypothetical protein DLM78_22480 [Leptospira stimsonii]